MNVRIYIQLLYYKWLFFFLLSVKFLLQMDFDKTIDYTVHLISVLAYGELQVQIIVTVLVLLFLILCLSLCTLFLTGLDVVVFDKSIVVIFQLTLCSRTHPHSRRDVVGEGHVLLSILAYSIALLQQRVSIAGQETVENTKLYSHNYKERESEESA